MILNIVVSTHSLTSRGYRYAARLNGRLLCISRTPFLSAARVLLDEGVDPETVLTSTREGSDTVSLRSTLGEAAKWTVLENERHGPKRVRYSPPPARRALQVHGCGPRTAFMASGVPH
jgi:hypothetical protein